MKTHSATPTLSSRKSPRARRDANLRHRARPGRVLFIGLDGEDGRDDGGDASAASSSGTVDLWTGRDAVWPQRE